MLSITCRHGCEIQVYELKNMGGVLSARQQNMFIELFKIEPLPWSMFGPELHEGLQAMRLDRVSK